MKINVYVIIFYSALILWTSCKKYNHDSYSYSKHEIDGETVSELGNSIMIIFQDKTGDHWFGSWKTGVYRYDGNTLINYTTKHGLTNNRIDEIKEDSSGNLYFVSSNSKLKIAKYDGKEFTTITATPTNKWELNSLDLWFRHSYENERKVYRYDGSILHELKLPNPPILKS